MNRKTTGMLLSPSFQDAFWSNIDPDIRDFLDEFETREGWTYSYDEIPDVFIELSKALPRLSGCPITEETSPIVQPMLRDLIVLLAGMPLRQAISAIAWLDQGVESSTQVGWAVAIYMEAAQVALHKEDDPNYAEFKLTYDRVDLILHSRLASLLFINLNPIGDKE